MFVGSGLAELPRTKRRDFECFLPGQYMDQAKATADDERSPEQRLYLFWRGIGSEVEVLGRNAEQQVPDRATNDECLETCLLEFARDVLSAARNLASADRMFTGTVYARCVGGSPGHQACEQAVNH